MAFNQNEFKPTPITTGTATQVFLGKGILHAVVIGETAAGAIYLGDGPSLTATTIFGVLKASIAEGTYTYNATCAQGLVVTPSAASKMTVLWSQS